MVQKLSPTSKVQTDETMSTILHSSKVIAKFKRADRKIPFNICDRYSSPKRIKVKFTDLAVHYTQQPLLVPD